MRVFFNPGIVLFIILLHLTPIHTNSITSKLLSDLFGGHKPEDLVITTVNPTIVSSSTTMPQLTIETTQKPISVRREVPGYNGTCGIFNGTFQRSKRVAGGYDAPRGFYPYVATIRQRKIGQWKHQCGATLIHPRYLLTAAHCFKLFDDLDEFRVVLGVWDNTGREETEQRAIINKVHRHPQYLGYDPSISHDIAIIELNSTVTINNQVDIACLPNKDFNYYAGRLCTVKGWGATNSGTYPTRLQVGLVPILNRESCINSSFDYRRLSNTSFCAGYFDGGIDTCGGDSGGPFVCQEGDGSLHVVGVTSWGIGCAQKNKPGVYTTVAAYIDWIEKILKGEGQ